MNQNAQIGDVIRFEFPARPGITGVLRYIPQATGDSWIIDGWTTGDEESVYYVQSYEFMTIVERAPTVH